MENEKHTVKIDKTKDFYDKDEIYCNWYKCPECGQTCVMQASKYCQECGVKFEWTNEKPES
jgi:hypothetical protein